MTRLRGRYSVTPSLVVACFVCFSAHSIGLAATKDCKNSGEPSWCWSAPSTKPGPDGEENPGCGRWVEDCHCTCGLTKIAVEQKLEAERLAKEAEEARIAARNAEITAHVAQALASKEHSEVTMSVLVRSQNVPGDEARIAHFRALGEQYAGKVEFLFVSDLDVQPHGRSNHANFGHWTLYSFLRHWQRRSKLPGDGADWFVVIEPWTDLDIPALQALLGHFDASENHFLGHGIHYTPSIITLNHDFSDLQVGPGTGITFIALDQRVLFVFASRIHCFECSKYRHAFGDGCKFKFLFCIHRSQSQMQVLLSVKPLWNPLLWALTMENLAASKTSL